MRKRITIKGVAKCAGVGVSRAYHLTEEDPKFPAPVAITLPYNRKFWDEDAVVEWACNRIDRRKAVSIR